MKKLMTVLASTAAALCAFGLSADLTTTGSSIESSGYVVGQNLVSTTTDPDEDEVQRQYWYIATADGGDNGVVVSNYEASATTTPIATRPEKFKDDVNTQFLALDTSSPLYRTALPNTQNPDDFSGATIGTDGIYLDTLVKFTAADDVFGDDALATGDKIAISYVEREDDDTTPEVNEALTNFVIRAGKKVGEDIQKVNYIAAVPAGFDKDAWHRLTVRAIADVGDGQVGFIVYLDGDMEKILAYDVSVDAGFASVSATYADKYYNSTIHAIYPSAVAAGATGGSTISAASFSGTGAIDDIVFTTDKPDFIQEQAIVTIAWDAGFTGVTIDNVAVTDQELAAGKKDVQLNGTVVSVSYTLASGYEEGTFTGGTWESGSSEGSGSFTGLKSGDTCTLVSMQPKFDVGGIHYESLEDALDAAIKAGTSAQSPATLKLLANCAECITLAEGYVIIDLAGHDIQGGDYDSFSITCKDGANVVVTNSIPSTGAVKLSLIEDAATAMSVKGDATRVSVYDTKFEGSIKVTPDDADETALLKVFSGTFYDDNAEGVVENFKYTKYIQNSAKVTYLGSDYFQVGEGSEQPTTYTVTVTPTANATYAAVIGETAVTFTENVATVDAGSTVVITATAATGYTYTGVTLGEGWTPAQDGATATYTIQSIAAAAEVTIPDPVEIVTPDVFDITYSGADNATVVTDPAELEDLEVNSTVTFTATPDTGYTYEGVTLGDWVRNSETGAISYTLTVTREEEVVIPDAVEKTYPSYIGTDTEKKEKYDAWADYADISATDFPDAEGTNEEAYLLNCKPSEVAAAKAEFKFTAFDPKNPKDVTNVSTGYNERTWNGEVVIKQYSDVGCETESATGTFFRAVLQ